MSRIRVLRSSGLLALLVSVLIAYAYSVSPALASPSTGLPVPSKNAAGYMNLSAKQLSESMPGKKFTLVNVHVPLGESLPNTDLMIPFDKIAANLDKLPGKNAPIVIYCRSGGMSAQVAAALAAAGYTTVYELRGGFNAWKAAGYKLASR